MDFEGEGSGADGGACGDFAERLGRRLAGEEPLEPAGDDRAEDHSRECPECGALEGLIQALAEIPPLASSGLVRRALESHASLRRRRRVRLAVLSAGGLAAAAALLLLVLLPAAPAPEEAGAQGTGGGRALVTEGPALLSGLGGVAVGIGTGARAAVEGLDGERARCVLESGTAAFMVSRGTASVLDVVVGTATVLLAAPGGGAGGGGAPEEAIALVEIAGADVSVDVVSGSVVFVLDGSGGKRREIALVAGQGAGTARAGLVPVDEDRRLLALDLLGLRPAMTGKGTGEGTVAGEGREEPADDVVASDGGHRIDKDERDGRAAGDGRRRMEIPGKSSPLAAGELIAMAREQRTAGNWNAAAELYRQVLDEHHSRPEATAVLVPLAELELEHLRRPDLALRHFGLYVGKLPGGPLGEEALWGRCQALRALGRANEEAEALTAFLMRYPGSVRAPGAKSRLDNLGERIE